MAKPTRLKSPAVAVPVPASRQDAAEQIRTIGDLTREHARLTAELNDQVAAITSGYQARLDGLAQRRDALQQGVQAWCEAHRAELTKDGKVKSANLVTGEVQWRQRPPSVRITGAEAVMDTLLRLGLERFVRVKNEVNKEAILAEPSAVQGVAGISITTGVEDFVITPYEIDTEAA
jgi:phage host-nuclease inhibitor protein Gam